MQQPEMKEPAGQDFETDSWPEEGLERVKRCPVCGAPDRELVHERLTDRIFFCAPGTWMLYRCEKCASGYLDPRPDRETISLAYQKYYTHGSSGSRKNASDLGALGRLRRTLANGYRNAQYGTEYQPASRIGFWLAYLLPGQKRILDRRMRHLPKVPADGKLLDIGCGNGHFLKMAKEAGWNVVGVDPDPEAVAVAQQSGLEARTGGTETLENEKEQYDIITLSHVIEHVHDPQAVLAACHRLLKSGGTLWVQTPNLDSMGHQMYERHWRGLEPPRHLVLFTCASLHHALQTAGFHVIKAKSLPHLQVSKGMYMSSANIRRGKDPYDREQAQLPARLAARYAACRAWMDSSVAEFVILSAVKP